MYSPNHRRGTVYRHTTRHRGISLATAAVFLHTSLWLSTGAAFADAKKPAAKGKEAAKGSPAPKAAAGKEADKKGAGGAAFKLRKGHGLGRWKRNSKLLDFSKGFKFAAAKFTRFMTRNDASLATARKVAQSPAKHTVDALARALFVLEIEAPAEGKTFRQKVKGHTTERHGEKVEVGPDIEEQAGFYHRRYDVPCRTKLARTGSGWPAHYQCTEKPKEVTNEPEPILELKGSPTVVLRAPSESNRRNDEEKKTDKALAAERHATLAARDKFAVPHENLAVRPTSFCVQGKCVKTYKEAAVAIYGAGSGVESYPVFCAPKKKGDTWDTQSVDCSSQWLDTLGAWKPWDKEGQPSAPPEPGVIPAYACIGSPHLIKEHMIVPPGGTDSGSGFYCRNRIFRILAKVGAKSQADLNKNIVSMCLEMRGQVWGEKYPNINVLYSDWCNSADGPKDKTLCPKVTPGEGSGPGGAPTQPFMQISREEMLYFYGHQELYCRADRPGLTHFLFNKEWAKTFTCGIARGVVEAGPFEEGVQTCALVPFVGGDKRKKVLSESDLKARLHCWQTDRPTCEAVQRDQTKDDIHRSAVFDVVDALKEARRTRHADAWAFYDMKDADKLDDWSERMAFQDSAGDEGRFGVKDFCRFVGGTKKLRCGYTKTTMAQYYELHKDEQPEGCSSGICMRGAYKRGYYCGLFRSKELFCNEDKGPGAIRAPHAKSIRGCKAFWMCGIDTGLTGQQMVKDTNALCVGGARVKGFQSAKGDTTSLHCYEKRFLWGESEKSEEILRRFSWTKAVEEAAKVPPRDESWLGGGNQAGHVTEQYHKYQKAQPAKALPAVQAALAAGFGFAKVKPEEAIKDVERGVAAAKKALLEQAEKDEKDLARWAGAHSHTLGHLTSMRISLMRSNLPVVKEFRKLKFSESKTHKYAALGPKASDYYTFEYHPDEGDKEGARSKDKVKELNELVDDVRQGGRAADHKWYEAFRGAATEDGQLRIEPKELHTVVRLAHMFEVLATARDLLLREAKAYADAVFETAQKSDWYTRLEIHERARGAGIAARFKGNIFCVGKTDPKGDKSYRPAQICASSPLLVAGRVERKVKKRYATSKRPHTDNEAEKRAHKIRKKVKFDWCYGGTKDRPVYGERPSPALYAPDLSSPFVMGIPDSVLKGFEPKDKKPKKADKRLLETLQKGHGDAASASATEPTLPTTLLGAAAKPAKPAPAKASPKGDKSKTPALGKGIKLFGRATHPRSAVNWLKCQGFTYSDESWEDAAPKKEEAVAKAATDLPGAPPPPKDAKPDDMAKTAEKTAKMASDILALLMPFIRIVLPDLGKALDTVKDLANQAQEFYEKYVKKFVDVAKNLWETGKKVVEEAKKVVEDVTQLREKARELAHKKELAFAAADPNTKAKLQAEKDKAAEELKQAQNVVKDKIKEVGLAIAKALGMKSIPGTGDILSVLLEDLISLIVSKIMPILEPNVKWLMAKIYELVKPLIDGIGMAVVGAVGAIPFVGGALAPIAKFGFNYAIGALWKAATDALMPLVERILSKMVRVAATPVFTVVKKGVEKLVHSVCSAMFGSDICPKEIKFAALPAKDQWIERAIACKPREIIDDRVRQDAVAARQEVFEKLGQMRRNVHHYARDIADQYFARFGLTYDTWMAAAGSGRPEVVAQAAAIEEHFLKEAKKLHEGMKAAK